MMGYIYIYSPFHCGKSLNIIWWMMNMYILGFLSKWGTDPKMAQWACPNRSRVVTFPRMGRRECTGETLYLTLFDGKNPLVSFRFVFSPLENTSIESHSSWSQLKPTEWWSRHICQVLRHFFRIQCKGGGGTVPRECSGWQWCIPPPPNIWKKHVNTWKNRQFFQIFGQVGNFGDLFPAATNYELFWPWSLKAAGWNCGTNDALN